MNETKLPATRRRDLLKGVVAAGGAMTVAPPAAAAVVASCPLPLDAGARRRLARALKGRVIWRGEKDYETARGDAVYRANKPPRYPAVIVLPENDQDVVIAVRFARDHGLKVGRRSGGHGWSSAHLRTGAMLIDLSRMQDVEIDAASRTLWTRPGVLGSYINSMLTPMGLIIPTAHHPTVGIGGFAMCGGFGWNSRLWGNGAAHILAVDVVNAEGVLIRADETQNQDFLWAARGAGPGFFGVVTRMKLRANVLPKVMKVSAYGYTADHLEAIFTWARELVPQVPPYLELVITSTAHDSKTGERVPVRFTVAALAICDTDEEADRALALLETCPVLAQATFRVVGKPQTLTERYLSGMAADPPGFRFACDNMYTNASAAELVPRLRDLFTDLPTPHTHVFWLSWGPVKPFPDDMALSVQGEVFLGAYSLWDDAAQDEAMEVWPVQRMKKLAELSVGGQMNDENIARHPQRYLSDEANNKLEALRERHDPHGVFLSFLRSVT
ncbi:MAG: FAD-binding oxidoreductase [Burkholderiales bacterium]|nr:FAD-binding oxidoreductase [Burkholderiales bacterium]